MIRVCVISALYVVYAVLALQAIASSAVLHLYLSTVVTDDVARRLEHSVILILVAVPILATTTGVLAWKKHSTKLGAFVSHCTLGVVGCLLVASITYVNTGIAHAVNDWTLRVTSRPDQSAFNEAKQLREAGVCCMEVSTGSKPDELVILPDHVARVSDAITFLESKGYEVECMSPRMTNIHARQFREQRSVTP